MSSVAVCYRIFLRCLTHLCRHLNLQKSISGRYPESTTPCRSRPPPPTKKEAKDMIFHHRTWLYFYNEIQLKWTTRLNKLTIYTHCKCWPRPISNILCLLLFLQAFIVLCCCLLRRLICTWNQMKLDELTSTCLLQSFNPPWAMLKSLLQTVQRARLSLFFTFIRQGYTFV